MRKLIFLLAALALVATMAMPAFADTATDAKTWFEQRFEAKKAAVDKAVEEGRITAEQGQQMKEHFDQMYQYRAENGFTCPFGNRGMGCGGGFGRQGMGFGGMMQQNN